MRGFCPAFRHIEARYLRREITQRSEDPVFLRRHSNQRNCSLQSNYPICWMLCNPTDGMPRGDFNIYFASSRRGYVRAEEAVGIVLLVVILAALLLLGCWYFKKRSGYKIIRNPRSGSPGNTQGQYSEAGSSADNKMALTDFGSFRPVVPNAPPAYEKVSSGQLPPPYSP
ncbi:melanoma antigen recognized by T-cells 1 [Siniperca chuatsi]|uniref:melanoma antigen recognized by T-cells 1 n=1 Tax=Siniperca chuatsi TaxID=119488 RepID=UPI001CE10FAE|nr:melanoma antigen recognized by T-cells 1 [Siniperca chuatsi]